MVQCEFKEEQRQFDIKDHAECIYFCAMVGVVAGVLFAAVAVYCGTKMNILMFILGVYLVTRCTALMYVGGCWLEDAASRLIDDTQR